LGVPWGIDFLNADELIFTECNGHIKLLILDGSAAAGNPFLGDEKRWMKFGVLGTEALRGGYIYRQTMVIFFVCDRANGFC
jgi:hypothetical protein